MPPNDISRNISFISEKSGGGGGGNVRWVTFGVAQILNTTECLFI